jgi:hypothetical protein
MSTKLSTGIDDLRQSLEHVTDMWRHNAAGPVRLNAIAIGEKALLETQDIQEELDRVMGLLKNAVAPCECKGCQDIWSNFQHQNKLTMKKSTATPAQSPADNVAILQQKNTTLLEEIESAELQLREDDAMILSMDKEIKEYRKMLGDIANAVNVAFPALSKSIREILAYYDQPKPVASEPTNTP